MRALGMETEAYMAISSSPKDTAELRCCGLEVENAVFGWWFSKEEDKSNIATNRRLL